MHGLQHLLQPDDPSIFVLASFPSISSIFSISPNVLTSGQVLHDVCLRSVLPDRAVQTVQQPRYIDSFASNPSLLLGSEHIGRFDTLGICPLRSSSSTAVARASGVSCRSPTSVAAAAAAAVALAVVAVVVASMVPASIMMKSSASMSRSSNDEVSSSSTSSSLSSFS
ncbi:hypothetical protein KCU98_g20730, partial [Aureobasidium melanogenum]